MSVSEMALFVVPVCEILLSFCEKSLSGRLLPDNMDVEILFVAELCPLYIQISLSPLFCIMVKAACTFTHREIRAKSKIKIFLITDKIQVDFGKKHRSINQFNFYTSKRNERAKVINFGKNHINKPLYQEKTYFCN